MARMTRGWLLRGLGAGVLGTVALSAWEPLRDAWLGHPAPYAVWHLVSRGARRWLGVRMGRRRAQHWGLVLRWVYGPALGGVYAALRPVIPPTARLRGLMLGGGVWLFEHTVFPLLRVTPPPRSWSPRERELLPVQTAVFGLVAEAVLSRGRTEGALGARS